jgi:acyl-CoA synthetase (AMP-forming)/AMP-acid ligase II
VTSLADLLFEVEEDGSTLLVHEGGRDHSLDEVRARAAEVAEHLVASGVTAGAPVGVMLPNADVVAALFAVWRAGGAYVPLNPRLGASDLAHVLETVQPTVIVTTSEHVPRFGTLPVVVTD